MLRRIRAEKFFLIEDLELEFEEGINVITGETGTGKSMTIEAISFVLGKKGNYEEGTYVELEIEKESEEEPLILAREIKGGRSRFYINGRSSTLSVILELVEGSVVIHGQNDHLNILKADYRRDILDYFGGLTERREKFAKEFEEFNRMRREYMKLREDYENLLKEKEYLEFQVEEIKKIGISPEEYELIKKEVEVLSEKERVAEVLEKILQSLYYEPASAYNKITEILRYFDEIEDKEIREFARELEYFAERIREGIRILSSKMPDINQREVDTLNEKIFAVQLLEKKYKKPYSEIFEDVKKIEERMGKVEETETLLLKMEKDMKERDKKIRELAEELSLERRKCAEAFEKKVTEILKDLNMPDVIFKVATEETEIGKYGKDRVNFLFSSAGIKPMPLEEVASGGEISRLAFALSLIKPPADTYIFDEIDTGISGETSLKLAKMIRKLSENTQVIIITHSAPIASCGDVFFCTSKEKGKVFVKKLTDGEVLEEIARLMGIRSEHTLKGAQELLKEVRQS